MPSTVLHLDGNSQVHQPDGLRESYIPLHTTNLIDYLALHPSLAGDAAGLFRETTTLILALLHHLYRRRHERISNTYLPLDPDRDRLLLMVPTDARRSELIGGFFQDAVAALEHANYRRLTREDIQKAIDVTSRWGVRMRVDFELFDQLEVYARGSVVGPRTFRNWRKFFALDEEEVATFQRVVVMFRAKRAGSHQFDPRRVYLRMFKNVPQNDIDMLLPATGIQMTWLDHGRIVVPSLYAAAVTLWRFLRNVFLLALFGVFKTVGLIVLIIFAIGFGIKSMFTYRTHTQRRHLLSMTKSLYYQNLDNNNGVILRLLDEGEQQEACQAIIAFFAAHLLKREQELFSTQELSARCEELLHELIGFEIEFDTDDTLNHLDRLGLLSRRDGVWSCLDLEPATEQLNRLWDDRFQ